MGFESTISTPPQFQIGITSPVTMGCTIIGTDANIQTPQNEFVTPLPFTSAIATTARNFWQDERGSINLQNWRWSAILERARNLLSKSKKRPSLDTTAPAPCQGGVATKGEYGLATSGAELARLRSQIRLYDGGFVLRFIGEGNAVLDLASGIGYHAIEMARLVGPSGKVTGVDVDDAKIKFAKELVAFQNIENITFETGDAYRLKYPDNSFNVVHLRFLLQHMADPTAILKEVWRILKTGGKIITIDSADKTPLFIPVATTFEDVRRRFLEVIEKAGADWTIGSKMTQLLATAGFIKISSKNFQIDIKNSDDPTSFKQYFDAILPFVGRNGSWAIKLGQRATPDEMDNAQRELANLQQNPDTEFHKLITGIVAVKPFDATDRYILQNLPI